MSRRFEDWCQMNSAFPCRFSLIAYHASWSQLLPGKTMTPTLIRGVSSLPASPDSPPIPFGQMGRFEIVNPCEAHQARYGHPFAAACKTLVTTSSIVKDFTLS